MVFKTYATRIESYDDDSQKLAFTLETNDEFTAILTVDRVLVDNNSIDMLYAELKKAIALLELA